MHNRLEKIYIWWDFRNKTYFCVQLGGNTCGITEERVARMRGAGLLTLNMTFGAFYWSVTLFLYASLGIIETLACSPASMSVFQSTTSVFSWLILEGTTGTENGLPEMWRTPSVTDIFMVPDKELYHMDEWNFPIVASAISSSRTTLEIGASSSTPERVTASRWKTGLGPPWKHANRFFIVMFAL